MFSCLLSSHIGHVTGDGGGGGDIRLAGQAVRELRACRRASEWSACRFDAADHKNSKQAESLWCDLVVGPYSERCLK